MPRARSSRLIVSGCVAFGVVVLLLSVAISYRRRPSRECPVHLNHIGAAIALYAQDHGGQSPLRLEDLAIGGYLPPEKLVCPGSPETPAHGTSAQLAAQYARPGHVSYLYRPSVMSFDSAAAERPIVFDSPQNHTAGGYVLFADGAVRYVGPTEFKALLTQPPSTGPSSAPARPNGS